MKNFFYSRQSATFRVVQNSGSQPEGLKLIAALVLLFAAACVAPLLVSQAQKGDAPSKVWNVAAQPSGAGTVVWITADAPLRRAQNWQDSEGYHIVLPNTVLKESLRGVKGVKVRRVGSSVELLLQTTPGSKVSVQSEGNELSLLVDKKLDARGDANLAPDVSEEQRLFADPARNQQGHRETAPLKFSTPVEDLSSNSRAANNSNSQIAQAATTPEAFPKPGPVITTEPAPAPVIIPTDNGGATAPVGPQNDTTQVVEPAENEGVMASIFSGASVFVVMALGLFGLLVSRKLRSRQTLGHTGPDSSSKEADWVDDEVAGGTSLQARGPNPGEGSSGLVKFEGSAATNSSSRQSIMRTPVAGPTTLYGAYRIDQEVGKLLLGHPHRMDVLASRALDDRRAIETSLIKGVVSEEQDESARRRAREALEEYGFVARQCATLLLDPDAFERTSAARSLGEIRSEAALPFLLEGLYDSESIVRNQAVVSIGELKLPSAIGALLDIARTHPDVPSGLLSRTLSACSVEGLDFFDTVIAEPAQLGMGSGASIIEQITHLEPTLTVEELPGNSDDEQLALALVLVESSDVQDRSEALKILGQFRVQNAVTAMALVARNDSEPNIRSMAISSLGSIDHESVFPAILIGMADDSREVRASAARALNRLSFDRADAYVRVIETSDDATIQSVALACIQAGIVSQNLDRLASSDHRQAYETFSLICLLAKANVNQPILDAIAEHPNLDVRLKAVHLLASTGHPETFEQLRQLAVRDGVSEEVKTALLEAMYKLDQHAKANEPELAEPQMAEAELQDAQFEMAALETSETPVECGFEFAFAPAAESEPEPESEVEVQLDLDEL